MSTHNLGFNEEISKIITLLSSNMHLISSAVTLQPNLGLQCLLSYLCED